MDIKRQIYYQVRHIYRQIQRVKTWQLLLILILAVFVAATFLRLNNVGMVQRRESVLQADKDGRDEDTSNRMLDLQHYVSGHMNSDTGQFYLVEQYNRDYQRALNEAIDDSNPNGNINAQAEAVCRQRYPDYQSGTYLQYQQCFIDEISKYPPAPNPEDNFKAPAKQLYHYSYAAPRWSPDFAGFSVLFAVVVALIIVGRWLHFGFLYMLLKLRQRGIGS